MTGSASALALRDVSKRFGTVHALAGAAIDVRAGTVHALLGENGAGKSTLMRIAFGLLQPDTGTIAVRGTVRRMQSATDAAAAGIGMVHQHFSLVPAFTVAENVALGGRGRYDARAVATRIQAIGVETGLVLDPTALVSALPVSAQQRLEIVKALARDARILILDEPTAVLAPEDARELLAWVKRWAEGDRAAVLITHHLRDALAVADEVTVLRHGRTALVQASSGLTERALVDAMLGERAPVPLGPGERGIGASRADQAVRVSDSSSRSGAPYRRSLRTGASPGTARAAVLELHEATVIDARGVARLIEASCEIGAGEIVGVAAVEGAGQAELLRLLAGRLAPTRGTVTIPDDVAFVPADRQRDALALDFSLVENTALRGAGAARGLQSWGAIAERTAMIIGQFDVRTSGPHSLARALSGGNQQKFVLGRELYGSPRAMVAENPTRGLDIRAAEEVLLRIREAREAGLAVVVYSEDLDEVLALADRVLVVHAGRVHAMPPDRDRVGRAMLGVE